MAPHLQGRREALKPLSWYRALATSQGRAEHGVFAAEGLRTVRQLADVAPESLVEVLVSHDKPPALKLRCPVRVLTPQQFGKVASARTPQGIVAVLRIPADSCSANVPADLRGHVLLLEDVQDPGNLGTLIRSAAAFGFCGAVLSDRCADPFSAKAVQASAGSVLSLWIRRSPDYLGLSRDLLGHGYRLVAADVKGSERPDWCSAGRTILALGSEGAGLSNRLLALADRVFRLPIRSRSIESLNVASCGAICMYLLAQSGSGYRQTSGL